MLRLHNRLAAAAAAAAHKSLMFRAMATNIQPGIRFQPERADDIDNMYHHMKRIRI